MPTEDANPIDASLPAQEASALPFLRRLDLNLLLTFDSLMKTRSATATARSLHKTQPAISRELARLRERLGDPLLVVLKGRFTPTERALELHAVVRDSLVRIEAALDPPSSFDPAVAEGTVNIGTGAHIELLIAAPLLARLRQQAPGVTLRFQSVHGNFDPEDLDSDRMDLALGMFEGIAPRFHRRLMFTDRRVCLVAASHPLAGQGQLSLEDLPQLDWFAFAHMYGRETTFDRALKPLHRKMEFSAYLSGFGITPHVLIGSRYATTLPACVARLHQQHFPLVALGMPAPLHRIAFTMAWTQRKHNSPLHAWLRTQIEILLEELVGLDAPGSHGADA